MATYDTIFDYYACGTDTADKIARIDAIILALEVSMLKGAVSSHVSEYHFNDGQTIIRTIYRDVSEINKAISGLEQMKNRLINNNCLGRVMRLRDEDSFNC